MTCKSFRTPRIESKVYALTIDHSKTIKQLVGDADFSYADSDVVKLRDPDISDRVEVIQAKLVHLGGSPSSEQVLDELARRGLRAATLRELIIFGKVHPELHAQLVIVALGTTWKPLFRRYAGVLRPTNGCRDLGVGWYNYPWSHYVRFLAVKN